MFKTLQRGGLRQTCLAGRLKIGAKHQTSNSRLLSGCQGAFRCEGDVLRPCTGMTCSLVACCRNLEDILKCVQG